MKNDLTVYDGKGGSIMRLCRVEICGIKNVLSGTVTMPACHRGGYYDGQAEVMGIYGRNGSGKTAVIDALALFAALGKGEKVPNAGMVNAKLGRASCAFTFYYAPAPEDADEELRQDGWLLTYTVGLDADGRLTEEKLTCRRVLDGKRGREGLIAVHESGILSPKRLKKDGKRLAAITQGCSHRSLLFHPDFCQAVSDGSEGAAVRLPLHTAVAVLKSYAADCLHIVRAAPLFGQMQPQGSVTLLLPNPYGTVTVTPKTPIAQDLLEAVERAVTDTDAIMRHIVPGLRFSLRKSKDDSGHYCRLYAIRDGAEFPLSAESAGIRKLFAVFHLLIAMYRDESVCLVIDEMDAGLYEYLFGELLTLLTENGSGQLIFTSHNLRPLEILDTDRILFATPDPDNKYLRLRPGKGNLRDRYLRVLALGGDDDVIGTGSDLYEIDRAFRRAGKGEK